MINSQNLNDELADLRGLADDIFSAWSETVLDVQKTTIPFDPTQWKTLHDSGLTLLTTPEAHGGSGASITELAVVLSSAAHHCAPVPLAETDLLASWLLRVAGIAVPAIPLTAAYSPSLDISDTHVTGTLDRVPWATMVDAIVVANDQRVALVPVSNILIEAGCNLAHEPRDHLFIDTDLSVESIGPAPDRVRQEFDLRGALARSIQICGVAERALAMTVQHAGERRQFGHTLGKFQAVQALVSDAAGAVAMARAATELAVTTVAAYGFLDPGTRFAIAVAKTQTASAAQSQPQRPPGSRRNRIHPRPPTTPLHFSHALVAFGVRKCTPLGAIPRRGRNW